MLIAKRVPLRYIFGQIRWELAATFVLATFVSLGDNYIDKDLPPIVLPYFLSVVSVIIVFRTSQAYARWWEARRVWGNIVNDMRTLARQLLFFHSPQSADKILESYRAHSIQRLIAFPTCWPINCVTKTCNQSEKCIFLRRMRKRSWHATTRLLVFSRCRPSPPSKHSPRD